MMVMMMMMMILMLTITAIDHVQVPVIHALRVVLGGAEGGAQLFTFLDDSRRDDDHHRRDDEDEDGVDDDHHHRDDDRHDGVAVWIPSGIPQYTWNKMQRKTF